jgi:hypothetical protein
MERLWRELFITQADCDEASEGNDVDAFKYATSRYKNYTPSYPIACVNVEIAQVIVSMVGPKKFISSMADYSKYMHTSEFVSYLLDIGYKKGDCIGCECFWVQDIDIVKILCCRSIDIIYSDVVDDPDCLKCAIEHGYILSRDDFERALNLINFESLELIHQLHPEWTGNLGTPDSNAGNECPNHISIEDLEKCRQLGHTFNCEIGCTTIEADDILKFKYLCENGLDLRSTNYIRIALRYSTGVECLTYLIELGLKYKNELKHAIDDGIITDAVNLFTQNKRRKV